MERPSTPPTVLQPVFPLNEHMPRRDFKKKKNLIHCATRRFMRSKEQITHTSKRPRISRIRIYLVLSRLHRSQVARWSPKWTGSKPRYWAERDIKETLNTIAITRKWIVFWISLLKFTNNQKWWHTDACYWTCLQLATHRWMRKGPCLVSVVWRQLRNIPPLFWNAPPCPPYETERNKQILEWTAF